MALGNEDAGDDAAALLASRSLEADADVIRAGRPGPGLLDLLKPGRPVVLLDVIRSGAPAGTLHRISLEELAERVRARVPASSHGFGPAETLALGRELGRALPRGTLLGVEGTAFGPGEEPGPAVRAAIPELAAAARAEVRRLAALGASSGAAAREEDARRRL